MADVVHRTTVEYRRSVHAPDFPEAEWIHNPDLSALSGVPSVYWKVVGDSVLEMTPAEKTAKDAAMANAVKASVKSAADAAIDGDAGYDLRAIAKLALDEVNALRQWITSFKAETAAATNLSNFQSRVAGLPNLPDRTLAQAKAAYKNLIAGTDLDE